MYCITVKRALLKIIEDSGTVARILEKARCIVEVYGNRVVFIESAAFMDVGGGAVLCGGWGVGIRRAEPLRWASSQKRRLPDPHPPASNPIPRCLFFQSPAMAVAAAAAEPNAFGRYFHHPLQSEAKFSSRG